MARKMKMNAKLKTIVKNDIEFIRIMAKCDKNFWIFINQSREIVKLEPLNKSNFIQWRRILNLKSGNLESNWSEMLTYWKDSQTEMLRILSKVSDDQKKEFLHKIENFRINNGLTTDWFIPILILVTTGFFMPPMFNLSFEVKDKETVLLEINSSTRISDIKEAWNEIKDLQKEIKQYERKNITISSGKGLFDYLRFLKEKSKKYGVDSEKNKYRLYDIDCVVRADIPKSDDGKDDLKATNRVRQYKSRIKK